MSKKERRLFPNIAITSWKEVQPSHVTVDRARRRIYRAGFPRHVNAKDGIREAVEFAVEKGMGMADMRARMRLCVRSTNRSAASG